MFARLEIGDGLEEITMLAVTSLICSYIVVYTQTLQAAVCVTEIAF